MTGRVEEI